MKGYLVCRVRSEVRKSPQMPCSIDMRAPVIGKKARGGRKMGIGMGIMAT